MSGPITLAATTRSALGSPAVGRLRATGKVPGVVYGKGTAAVSVAVDHHELRLAFADASRRKETFTLNVDGVAHQVTMHEIQRHPVKGTATHVDFLLV
jgi:large subunit ribosomal protein L25